MVSPQAKREAVTLLLAERDFGVARACGLVGISRSLYRYRSRRPDSAALRSRIEEIAALKRRYGYRRVYLRLRREGWPVPYHRNLAHRVQHRTAAQLARQPDAAGVRRNPFGERERKRIVTRGL